MLVPLLTGICGSCGYELNLSSSNRDISTIGSKYGKSIKRGIITFSNIDDDRFGHVDEIECAPNLSKLSWRLFRRKTKLICRKCCNHIGYAYNTSSSSIPLVSVGAAESEPSSYTKYEIRIRALQPSSSQDNNGITVVA
ncbi:uncharacterized protein At4g08330, chloroplastic isoform X2 [Arachis ipaensis]|uniref:uncharacterized protein At4g08330, chloroplastic isoform X2 n=1 Tax=Arachis ipaensis TaxID=130454 RepID=UPI0007AF57FC|nr:uncharacterized protein At4g08330, chloroplastic isoform X2 [Arachis ipaensis]XP_025668066.1 uncharacterized protein At4g08330, chloroplastic-like isoform X2 [Arachis hypogaea]